MATSTSDPFPLATDEPYNEGDSGPGSISSGGSIDDSAGAAGSSPGVIQISHGAIVAIIVVVAVVCVLGSEFFRITAGFNELTRRSLYSGALLPGQEEGMEG